MPSDLEWDEAYETGLPEIDAQHRVLVQLVGRISPEANRSEAIACVLHLFRYAREHFATEELLMEQVGFPDLEAHRVEHGRLVQILAEATREGIEDGAGLAAFKAFLSGWLVDHIARSDLEIGRHVRRSP